MLNTQDDVNYQTRDTNDPLFTPMVGCLIAGSKCTYKNGVSLIQWLSFIQTLTDPSWLASGHRRHPWKSPLGP